MDIYDALVAALRAGERVVLATVVSTAGSTPVPAGARMLIREGARIPLGTVGGGCVEAAVQEEARRVQAGEGSAGLRTFHMTEDDIESGMLCGGRVDILVEELTPRHAELFERLLELRERGDDAMLVTALRIPEAPPVRFLLSSFLPADRAYRDVMAGLSAVSGELPPSLEAAVAETLRQDRVLRLPCAQGEVLLEPVPAPQEVILFGGGHVSRSVSRSATLAGFRVTVVDDRPEYANPDRFPEAFRTLAVPFTRAWEDLHVTRSTSIVIVTRGHKFDEDLLERAVRTPARYIGMIGSRAKVLATFRHLTERGMPADLLAGVRAPIGLAIGAVTAGEIGISITAELVAVRRGVPGIAAPMAERR